MSERKMDVLRERPLTWDHDPYRGVDVSMMRDNLKLTPEERFWQAVESSNNLREFLEKARPTLRRK